MPMTLDGSAGMTAPQGAVYNGLQQMTAQATTSGANIDFTGIPLWVRRITISFNAVDVSAGQILIQLGSGTFTTSGYTSTGAQINTSSSSNVTATSATNGFAMRGNPFSGNMVLINVSGNIWAESYSGKVNTTTISVGGGEVTLSGSVDRLRVTTNGANTFTAGSVNVIYE